MTAIQPVTSSVLKSQWNGKNTMTGEQIKRLFSLIDLFLLYKATSLLLLLSIACTGGLKKETNDLSVGVAAALPPLRTELIYTVYYLLMLLHTA